MGYAKGAKETALKRCFGLFAVHAAFFWLQLPMKSLTGVLPGPPNTFNFFPKLVPPLCRANATDTGAAEESQKALWLPKKPADRHLSVADWLQVERRGQQMHQRSLPASPPVLLQPGRQRHHRRRRPQTVQQPLQLQGYRQRGWERYECSAALQNEPHHVPCVHLSFPSGMAMLSRVTLLF